ncbi:MAG: hypothetical protein B7Z55_08250, partial [Planctomycetales bacterium 12-60-4]
MLRLLKAAASTGAALVAVAGGTVSAQWFGGGGNSSCNCGAPVATAMVAASYAAPTVTACNVCAPVVQTVCAPPVQPVMQTVYRQVPVTEYQPVKEIARRQVFETKYVDQAVTAYRPITETKVAEVPTVSYQNVTECQTQYRNAGYWRTRSEPNCRMSPCQFDQRPGLAGWFNRTSYEMASAFQPQYRTTREYVPQTIAQAVPVTRQVAIQGTRQVSYNLTRMEPYQTTQKVAISVPRWEDSEVTVMKPITVVKTMAVGTQISYLPIGSGTSATALAPIPEPTRRADALQNANPNTPDNRRGSIDGLEPQHRSKLIPTSYPPVEFSVETESKSLADRNNEEAGDQVVT